jgi:signal peptidase II
VVALDQWSKDWAQAHLSSYEPRHVVGPVNLVLEFNKGAAFSLGTGVYPVVVAVAVVLVAGVLVFSGRAVRGGVSLPVATGLGLLCGGAVSNLADRFLRHHHGAVVDFVQAVSWWPTFNVADAAITVGAVVLAAAVLLAGPPGARPTAPYREGSG